MYLFLRAWYMQTKKWNERFAKRPETSPKLLSPVHLPKSGFRKRGRKGVASDFFQFSSALFRFFLFSSVFSVSIFFLFGCFFRLPIFSVFFRFIFRKKRRGDTVRETPIAKPRLKVFHRHFWTALHPRFQTLFHNENLPIEMLRQNHLTLVLKSLARVFIKSKQNGFEAKNCVCLGLWLRT